jgi:hypothetical protein
MQSFTSVPFKNETALTHVHGIAKFSSAGIVFEFEGKFLGLIAKGIKEAKLPIAEILDVKFKKGVMKRGARIDVRLKSMVRLKDFPNEQGKIVLRIGADDWHRARDAVTALEKDLAEAAASLPPVHTSVSSLFDGSEDDAEKLSR